MRILVRPALKALRAALGLTGRGEVDVSLQTQDPQVVPDGQTARLVEEDGRLVARSDTVVTDEAVFALNDATRR